jgi:hypothetical protein
MPLVEDDALQQGRAQALHCAAFHLRAHHLRIDGLAHVKSRHNLQHLDLAGLGVDSTSTAWQPVVKWTTARGPWPVSGSSGVT